MPNKPNRERDIPMMVYLSEEEKRLMEELARRTGKSQSDIVRETIIEKSKSEDNPDKS